MRLVAGVSLVLLLALVCAGAQNSGPPSATNATDKPVVIVGIASPTNSSRSIFNADWERDSVVRDINDQQVRDKKAKVHVHAVALDGSSLDEVSQQARDQKCNFVTVMTVAENNGVVGYDSAPGIPNPMQPNSNQPPNQNSSPMAAQNLGVQYRISRLGEPGSVSHGTILAPGTGDGFGQSAVQGAFRDVATRIRQEVQKQKPPAVN